MEDREQVFQRGREKACDRELVYAARSDFLASLETEKAYRCTATLGQKFQAYVRVIDESGEAYWYPERFFAPPDSAAGSREAPAADGGPARSLERVGLRVHFARNNLFDELGNSNLGQPVPNGPRPGYNARLRA